MDHEVVVRQKMTEKYLLDELEPEARDEFEEHYFDCPKCAFDVRAGAAFVDQSKAILAETREAETDPRGKVVTTTSGPGWFAWLRPAFAAPALALLLVLVGYQNVVTIPTMAKAVHEPRVLAWGSVNIGTYGEDGPTIKTSPGQGFLLFARIPARDGQSNRFLDLYNPAGKLEWSMPIPDTTQGQWPVVVPAADRPAGTYKLSVRGTNAAGATKTSGQASFELQIQK